MFKRNLSINDILDTENIEDGKTPIFIFEKKLERKLYLYNVANLMDKTKEFFLQFDSINVKFNTKEIDCSEKNRIIKKIMRGFGGVIKVKEMDCYVCKKYFPKEKLKKCSACRDYYYCSIKCQKEHWIEGEHKKKCSGKFSS